jgi:class 3 adenylate cyclase
MVKLTGDGALVEFPSVVEAVLCAVDVQRIVAGRNAEVPQDQRIEFRIGVNLGDVIIENDEIYGDGVNVAARLQTLAEPGASASRAPFTTTSGTRSTSRSSRWAGTRSRTSPSRSRCTGCGPARAVWLKRDPRYR